MEELIRPLLNMFCDKAAKQELPADVFWNVNIPHLPVEQVKGIVPASLSLHHYVDKYSQEAEGYLLMREYPETALAGEAQDYQLVKQGYIAVTPVHIDATDRTLLQQMSSWLPDKNPGKREE